MSNPPSLPSFDEVKNAVEVDPTSTRCRRLVLQALSYGTGAGVGIIATKHNESPTLQERSQEASKVLTDAWEEFPSLEDVLADCLWLCSSMLPSSPDNDASRAFVEILKSLVQVEDRTQFWTKLQGNLVPLLLDRSGLASEQELLKKLKIHNTQVHYKQQKYNLLQEESEGYSKVLHFLVSGCQGDATEWRRQLRQLIGAFELDPSRVLDLLLDVLEAKLHPAESTTNANHESKKPQTSNDAQISWLVDLVRDFSAEKLPPLIVFKLSGKDELGEVPLRLQRTIAFLAAEKVLDLSILVEGYLPPIGEQIQEAHKVFWMKEKIRIQALGRVSLSGTSKDDPKQAQLTQRLEKLLQPLAKSQALKLILILLEWQEWELVKPLLSRELWSKLCTLLPTKFGFALCDLVQHKVSAWSRSRVSTLSLQLSRTPLPLSNSEPSAMEVDHSNLTLDTVVKEVSDPILCTVQSSCIRFRPVLFCQLCRLFRSLLASVNGDTEMFQPQLSDDTYAFFKAFMVPSLSLFPANPAISTELWSVLKCLPYATRYRLYGDWRGAGLERSGLGSSVNGKPLSNVESEMMAGKAARYALKRLSKDTIRDMSRQLSKVAHSNPLVVFATILNQIESYDNMIEVMVESQRYVNALGLDVLGYCILIRLSGMAGGVNRSRLKEDGVNVSQWLQSLESFAGAFYKRCPHVEFRGMLSYLTRRLRDGNVMELGMLRTLLKTPGGYSFADYSPASSLNSTQLEGRAGSMTLKRETMSFGIVEDMDMLASDRIRDVLQSDGYGVSIIILIAQVRSSIIFETSKGDSKPLKLIGNLYDSCQVVSSILLEFLTNELNSTGESGAKSRRGVISKYADAMPTLAELHSLYGFDAVSAWTICRPLVRAATAMDASEAVENGGECGTSGDRLKLFRLNDATRKTYQTMLPDSTWSAISPALFETFFTNGLFDIFCPEHVYAAETTRITKEIERIQQRQKSGSASSLHPGAGPPKNEDDDLARLKSVSAKLSSDLIDQKQHVASVLGTFETRKADFFPSKAVSQRAVDTFLRECVYPRSTQSPDDALYCARFASLIHEIETPGFSTIHYIDSLISVYSGALVCVTEGEAAHLAILLWETWKIVNKWRYDEKAYDEETSGKPGACILRDADGMDEAKSEPVSHKDFSSLFNQWHKTLGNALIGCLKSPEYMHTRACLVVLTRIVEVFPTQPFLGNRLLEVLAPLRDESSSRPDIRASADAYGRMLLKARDDGRWVEEDAAVVKARTEKERVAAEERKRKIAEQFKEMKRESEQITDQIGSRDRHDRRRIDFGDSRTQSHVETHRSKSPLPTTSDNGAARSTKDDQGYRALTNRGESGEISSRDRRDHHDRRSDTFVRSSPPRGADLGRDRERAAAEDRGRGRTEPGSVSGGRPSDKVQHSSDARRREGSGVGEPHRTIRDEIRGLGDRWSRSDSDGRGRSSKRSRPSSPETVNDISRRTDGRDSARDGRPSKRPRSGEETRGSSPARRRSSPPRTPPSRNTGRRAKR